MSKIYKSGLVVLLGLLVGCASGPQKATVEQSRMVGQYEVIATKCYGLGLLSNSIYTKAEISQSFDAYKRKYPMQEPAYSEAADETVTWFMFAKYADKDATCYNSNNEFISLVTRMDNLTRRGRGGGGSRSAPAATGSGATPPPAAPAPTVLDVHVW